MSALRTAAPGTGTVLGRAVAAEWTRMRTVRTTWWCLLTAAATVIGLGTLIAVDEAGSPDLPAFPAWVAGQYGMVMGQFALLVLVLLAVTPEYASGMIGPTLQWTPRRGVLLAARVALPVLVVCAAGVLMALVADVATWLLAPELEMAVPGLVESLGRVAVVLAAGGMLTTGLGLLLRSTAGALAVTFALLLVLPLLLPAFGIPWLAELAELLPGSGATSLLIGEPEMSTAAAVGLLAAWAAAGVAVGGWSLLRRDAT
jgi:ABC-2 type transport system permease protein